MLPILWFVGIRQGWGGGLLKGTHQRLMECQRMVAAASRASPKMEALELPQ